MVVPGTPVLVPGTPVPPSFPLARHRSPELRGAVRAFIRSTTEPGDLILAIGAVSGEAVNEVVTEGRRVVALGRNPLDLLCAALGLDPVSRDQILTALTQLGDQPKAGRPLALHIKSQYESLCPHCNRMGTAEWFAWDRERGQPFAKRVVCRHCDQAREGPVDAEDLHRAGKYPVTSGPVYHLALNRAAGQDPSDVPRIAQLIQLYTPRNLSALLDLIQRIPQLHADQSVLRVIDALLIEALDAGSALVPYETPDARPRSLRAPQRFLERNVWMVLEKAAAAYHRCYDPEHRPSLPPGQRAGDLTAFLTHPEQACVLLNRSIQSLSGHNLEGEFSGLIVHLAPPDATFWALSVLWSLWLWDDSVPSDLRGFLQRRRLDWDWYQRSLAAALSYARPHLAPKASVLLLTSNPELSAPKAIVHAVNRSGLAIDRWILCPHEGCRVLTHDEGGKGPDQTVDEAGTSFDHARVAVRILQQRGEPMPQHMLEAATVLHTRREDLRDLKPGAAGPLTALTETILWLRAPSETAIPLADRVETMALDLLASEPSWSRAELLAELYGAFHSDLSPEPALVEAIIQAYTLPGPGDSLSLRPEDDPQRRRREQQRLRKDLLTLGERLDYDPVRRLNGDLVWREDGTHPYLFRMTTSAVLGQHLLKAPPRCDGRRCLVLPGGRAALIALKLRRDPRLAQLAAAQSWTFIKFRHLRRMFEEITDRAEIEVFLGLDPIVEKPGAQIPLPFHIEARP